MRATVERRESAVCCDSGSTAVLASLAIDSRAGGLDFWVGVTWVGVTGFEPAALRPEAERTPGFRAFLGRNRSAPGPDDACTLVIRLRGNGRPLARLISTGSERIAVLVREMIFHHRGWGVMLRV
jgi:hypothetical protein